MSGSATNRYERAKRRQGSGNVPGDELSPEELVALHERTRLREGLCAELGLPREALRWAEPKWLRLIDLFRSRLEGGEIRTDPALLDEFKWLRPVVDTGDIERLDYDLAVAAYCLRLADLEPDLAAELEGRADAAIEAAEAYEP